MCGQTVATEAVKDAVLVISGRSSMSACLILEKIYSYTYRLIVYEGEVGRQKLKFNEICSRRGTENFLRPR